MREPTADLAAVAGEAVRASGDYLRTAFRNGRVDGEYDAVDVKAAADRAAQRRIRSVIESHYPDHAVDGEESDSPATAGESTDGIRWVVDPLDGTNNFASGLPKFAAAAAACHDGEPVAAAIYEPLVDELYLAERGDGATLDSEPLRTESALPLAHGTVAFVVGLDAATDPAEADRIEALEAALWHCCKRVVTTWAPCVDWGLLARGSIEGLVAFRPGVYEQAPGALVAAESGVAAVDTLAAEGLYAAAPTRAVAERLHEIAAGSEA
ncbi:inositol monophosphatase family protein [Halohasta salina]|uniref:inositol monophosphatase family protein n=1 Tax=Halohasta salina TaxID=2961621 RepID=UPI0020A406B4|nr:inositol monophosphatase family protein [Halohasta salina]